MERRKPAIREEKPHSAQRKDRAPPPAVPEVGGRGGAEPTRYGDWEVNGVCTDF
ncbi:DUF1674 domain-containing protein [Thermaurantiacus sp.]